VFCGVETDHEGRDVDELVADADVAVLDEHACVVDGLGQSHEEDLSLQAALEEVFRLEVKDVVKLHFVFFQDAVAHQAPQQRIAFEQAAGVLLVKGEQFTGCLARFGQDELDAPYLTLAAQAVFANELELLVEALLLVWATRSDKGLGADLWCASNPGI